MAGSTGKSLVQKLGIQPGFCIFTAGAPAPCGDIIGQLPAPVTVVTRLRTVLDMVHVLEAEPGAWVRVEIHDSRGSADQTPQRLSPIMNWVGDGPAAVACLQTDASAG